MIYYTQLNVQQSFSRNETPYDNWTYYVCVILDLYARKVVAHRIPLNNSTQLTKRTFKLAYESRQPKTTFYSTLIKAQTILLARLWHIWNSWTFNSLFLEKEPHTTTLSANPSLQIWNGKNCIAVTIKPKPSSSMVCITTSHSTILKDLIPSSAIKRRINTRRCTISTIQTVHVWFKRKRKIKSGCRFDKNRQPQI